MALQSASADTPPPPPPPPELPAWQNHPASWYNVFLGFSGSVLAALAQFFFLGAIERYGYQEKVSAVIDFLFVVAETVAMILHSIYNLILAIDYGFNTLLQRLVVRVIRRGILRLSRAHRRLAFLDKRTTWLGRYDICMLRAYLAFWILQIAMALLWIYSRISAYLASAYIALQYYRNQARDSQTAAWRSVKDSMDERKITLQVSESTSSNFIDRAMQSRYA